MSAPRSSLLLAAVRSAPRTFGLTATLPGALAFAWILLRREDVPRLTPLLLGLLSLASLAAGVALVARQSREPAALLVAGPLLALPILAANLALAFAGCATADQGAGGGFGWSRKSPDASSPTELRRIAALLPPRPAQTPASLPDLGSRCNATLGEFHYTRLGRQDLHALKPGLQVLGGVPFDVRGLIRLSSRPGHDGNPRKFPDHLDGLPLACLCRKLHILLGMAWGPTNDAPVAHFRLHYADGRQVDIPVVHGRDVLASWVLPESASAAAAPPSPGTSPTVVWQEPGDPTQADANASRQARARLFLLSWLNPHPGDPLATLDFDAKVDDVSTPFLVAITPDPWEPASP